MDKQREEASFSFWWFLNKNNLKERSRRDRLNKLRYDNINNSVCLLIHMYCYCICNTENKTKDGKIKVIKSFRVI